MPFKAKTHNPLTAAQRKQVERSKGRIERRHDKDRLLYKMAEWRDPVVGIRARRLVEEPLCRECLAQGLRVVAVDVDHVKPHRGDITLFLDYDNTQSLCKAHHSSKTARENAPRTV